MGQRDVWDLDLSGVFGQAQRPRRPPQVRFPSSHCRGASENLKWDSFICEFSIHSFVRSVSMDKWKDLELEKMKVGGNRTFRMFLELQDDYDPSWSLQEKYNSKVAALFRDKVRRSDIRNTLFSSSIDLMTVSLIHQLKNS